MDTGVKSNRVVRWVVWSALVLALVASCTVMMVQVIGLPLFNRTVFTSTQPSSVSYADAAYQVDVVRQQQPLSTHYTILIHRIDVPQYGYALNYPQSVFDEHSLISKATWSERGLELEFPDRATLFVPAKNFMGGR